MRGEKKRAPQDVADLLGDTVFICADSNHTSLDHYEWVSRYTLQVSHFRKIIIILTTMTREERESKKKKERKRKHVF